MAVALLLLLAAAAADVRAWDYHGVVFGGGEWSTADARLGSARANASLRAAFAEAGASTIRLVPTWYTDSTTSTAIYRGQVGSPFETESDEAVAMAISAAKEIGMAVMLSPLVDPDWTLPWIRRGGYPGAECLLWRTGKEQTQPPNCTKSGDLPAVGRGDIGQHFEQNLWDQWFASYETMLAAYARLGQVHGADVLVVAAGLRAAMVEAQNVPRWVRLIQKVRGIFKGKLAVAQEARTLVPWHDAVDLLGFDMYAGLEEGHLVAKPVPPTVQELSEGWLPYVAWLKNVSAHTGKPVFASEVGFQSRPRSFVSPAGAARFNPGDCSVYYKCYSMEDQRLAYASFYRAFGDAGSWFKGVLWWLWRSDPTSGGVNDATFTPRGKPAANEMKKWSLGQRQIAAQPPLPALPPAQAAPDAASSRTVLPGYSHKDNGVVFGSGEWTSFEDGAHSSKLDSEAAAASMAKARAVGVNAIEFIPTWFFPADSSKSTHMYRGDSTLAPLALATDTDDELRAGIATAKALGMKVSLSPMFDPDYSQLPVWNASSGGPSEADTLDGGGAGRALWGDTWTRDQVSAWFQEYGDIIVEYARLAEETKCDEYHVGHELHTMLTDVNNEVHWRTLIGRVRAVYKGKVSVAFNGNPFFDDVRKGRIPWLSELDLIGLDCYWPLYTNLSKLGHWWDVASPDDVALAWQPVVEEMAKVVRASNLTITCTEVGYQSRNYAWIRGLNDVELDPLDCSSTAQCVNLQAQANAYEGLFKALYPHDWFNGVYLWLWRADPAAGGSSDDSYTPQQKPAQEVMRKYFGGQPAGGAAHEFYMPPQSQPAQEVTKSLII